MKASDPRFAAYQELQQSLCVLLNLGCHFDAAMLPIDPLTWYMPDGLREKAEKDFKADMTALLKGGSDDVPLPE